MPVGEQVDARKQRVGPEEALRIARQAKTLVVARGKKIVTVDLAKDDPRDAELLKLLLGPSGNLRAPTLRVGPTLLVGFAEESYAKTLAG